MTQASQYTLSGKEKGEYLKTLDKTLSALAASIRMNAGNDFSSAIREFGEREKWNWGRLPIQSENPTALADSIDTIREQYRWLDWLFFPESPEKNRGWFGEMGIYSSNGLPWQYDFISLGRLKEEANDRLEKMASFEQSGQQLHDILISDAAGIELVSQLAAQISTDAIKRNFLMQLKESKLVGYHLTGQCLEPQVKKIITRGGEDCWNICLISYSLGSGMFQVYLIDTWQDILNPQITENKGKMEISPEFRSALKFSDDNMGWYILQSIDEQFESLHPVHVTRALIGPFESKYCTNPRYKPLEISREILKKNPEAKILRASVQYTYAPNQQENEEGRPRQIVYREDWRDEFIVCPGEYATLVSSAVLGDKVKVVKY